MAIVAPAEVRVASAGDGLAIAWVQLEVWRAAFAGLLPAEVIATPPAELASAWTSTFRAAGANLQVAMEGEQLVGFVHTALNEDDPTFGEIRILHVRPAWARRGHGGRLIAAAGAQLRSIGAERGLWWIPAQDPATNSFAQSIGWAPDGAARAFDTGTSLLREERWLGSLNLVLGGVPDQHQPARPPV